MSKYFDLTFVQLIGPISFDYYESRKLDNGFYGAGAYRRIPLVFEWMELWRKINPSNWRDVFGVGQFTYKHKGKYKRTTCTLCGAQSSNETYEQEYSESSFYKTHDCWTNRTKPYHWAYSMITCEEHPDCRMNVGLAQECFQDTRLKKLK